MKDDRLHLTDDGWWAWWGRWSNLIRVGKQICRFWLLMMFVSQSPLREHQSNNFLQYSQNMTNPLTQKCTSVEKCFLIWCMNVLYENWEWVCARCTFPCCTNMLWMYAHCTYIWCMYYVPFHGAPQCPSLSWEAQLWSDLSIINHMKSKVKDNQDHISFHPMKFITNFYLLMLTLWSWPWLINQ